MPLIMMTGYPSSGKSTRAQELKQLLEHRLSQPDQSHRQHMRVQVISDQTLGVSRLAYQQASQEKLARGSLLSAVERLLSRETIVIADTPNYIKGLRYQLYCIAREISTTQCVVYCALPADNARQWNQSRPEADQYPPELFDELVMRYEEPRADAKWDSPLFLVIQNDPNDTLPFDRIWDSLIEKRALAPNFATAKKPVAETNYLFELDKRTQEVISAVLEAQKSGVPMSECKVPECEERVKLPGRGVTLSELRRHRMNFTKLNKQSPLSVDRIAVLFVNYLNLHL